jgi:glycosyltransferase involved in cell wall biosynthesis
MTPLVLQIIPSLSAGGAERFVIELASRLPAFGYRTKIIVLFEGGPLRAVLRERGLSWVQLMDSVHSNRWNLMHRLSGLIQEEEIARRPAIVHTHLFGADFWTAASQIGCSRRTRPALISTAHGLDIDDSLTRRMARRVIAPAFDRVVSVSDEVKKYMVKTLGVSLKRAMTIDGMCLFQPSVRSNHLLHEPPHFVTVSRLIPDKGIETTLRALASVPPPWRYTIVGEGPQERDLKELAERLGIASRVEFLGVTLDVSSVLQSADFFLFPSRSEGLGSAALEAAWAGVPVLTSDLDPLRSVFPSAQRLPIDNVSAWVGAIKLALANSSEMLASAAVLAPKIASRFHPDVVTEQYARLYGDMLRERI